MGGGQCSGVSLFGGVGSTGDRNGLAPYPVLGAGKLGGAASATCSKELVDIGGEGCCGWFLLLGNGGARSSDADNADDNVCLPGLVLRWGWCWLCIFVPMTIDEPVTLAPARE